MSAHASKPSKFLCVNLGCQGYSRNQFVKVYRWVGKTEVIMVAFTEDNASICPRKNLIRKYPHKPLGSAKGGKAFLLKVGASLLTVELLCLQSILRCLIAY